MSCVASYVEDGRHVAVVRLQDNCEVVARVVTPTRHQLLEQMRVVHLVTLHQRKCVVAPRTCAESPAKVGSVHVYLLKLISIHIQNIFHLPLQRIANGSSADILQRRHVKVQDKVDQSSLYVCVQVIQCVLHAVPVRLRSIALLQERIISLSV